MRNYTYTDYTNKYSRIMQFNKNKFVPIHRWYPFVEGYSSEFIESIIDEVSFESPVCLDPFSGSGTTTVEFQRFGYPCFSFEVNPLMYLISKVKLETYDSNKISRLYDQIISWKGEIDLNTSFPTLVEKEGMTKWNFNASVWHEIVRIRTAISLLCTGKYKDLFTVALAAILLDCSNLYRNGKCLSYKPDWKQLGLDKDIVCNLFEKKISEIKSDVSSYEFKSTINNKARLYNLDSRKGVTKIINDDSIDLVVTSPPYLNSRDYTDTYMLELKALNLTPSADDIVKLRKNTLRSHVQIKWHDESKVDNKLVNDTLAELEKRAEELGTWNTSIIDMVRLYFVDMDRLFDSMSKKVKKKGRVYFNVSNSAYFGYTINTLDICATIAEKNGLHVNEIRKARYLKTSPQQKKTVEKLLEGVIVMEK